MATRGTTEAPERTAPPSTAPAEAPVRRARRAPQAPAGAVVPAAVGHAAPHRARRVAARARLRRRSSWPSSPRSGSRPRRATRWTCRSPSTRPRTTSAFAFLVTALLFAKAGPVRRPRRAPRAVEHRRRPLPGHGRDRAVRGRQRPAVLQLLHLLRLAVLRGRLRLDVPLRLRASRPARLLRAAGYQRRAVLVGTGEHIEDVAHALAAGDEGDQRHRLRLAAAAARQRPDLAGHARGPRRGRGGPPRRRGHHRRPRLPPARGGRARRPVPPARRRRAHRAVDDGDPRPPRGVRARPVGAAVRAQAAGLRGLRLRAEALVRPRRLAPHHAPAQPAAGGQRAGDQAHLARPGHLPLDAPGDRRHAVRVPEVPHDVPRRARPAGRRSRSTTRPPARCSRSATTRASRPSGASCGASRSTSCPSSSTSSAATCRSSGRARCPSATTTASRTGTRSATSCCPASPACGRSPAASDLDFDDLVRLDFLYLERWSVFLDLSILVKTVPAVLTRRGAF